MNRHLCRWAIALLLPLAGLTNAHAQSCLTLYTHSPSYDSFYFLASSGTANAPSQYNHIVEGGGGTRDDDLYAADDGSSNVGDTYSYGMAGNSERAMGTLRDGNLDPLMGRCYKNVSVDAFNALDVVYTTEQWRRGAADRIDRLDFQYSLDATAIDNGTWHDWDTLDSTTIPGTAVGALDGNTPENQEVQIARIPIAIPSGATIFFRWRDHDAAGEDDGLAIDELWVTGRGPGGPCCGSAITVGDATVTEGDDGITYLNFPVTLNREASETVYFNYSTVDGTAIAGEDYVAVIDGVGQIQTFSQSTTIQIAIKGDVATEGDETLSVVIGNYAGNVVVVDGQGAGVIQDNDNFPLTPIHGIQGSGYASPALGQKVVTEGIVTARKANGFFLQSASGAEDADPATSQGLFVQTNGAPPASAARGSLLRVTGTVLEIVSPGDAPTQSMTVLGGSPILAVLATEQPLPAAVELSATFPHPDGAYDQLERIEGMRATVPALRIVAPTGGTRSEDSDIAISNGDFLAVVQSLPRPFQEPGIAHPVNEPSGSTATSIPHWNGNPEVFGVDMDGAGGTFVDVSTAYVMSGLTGPVEFTKGRYTIVYDPTQWLSTDIDGFYQYVRDPLSTEFTVASYNLQRFFDDVDDPLIAEPVLMPGAWQKRLAKASRGIREHMRKPDILVLAEVENLQVLQQLATRINQDAVAAGESDPAYVPLLEEGNDALGLDIGLLVKTAEVGAGRPRIELESITQLGKATTWVDPRNNLARPLNDRPPLLLQAIVHYVDGGKFPVSILAVNPTSRMGIASETTDGLTNEGSRVRRKRQAEAEYLANQIQQRQAEFPKEHLLVIGDFEAFEFNDGYADTFNTIKGTPSADDVTAVPGDGRDLVEPDLISLLPFDETSDTYRWRYSAIANGNAQVFDHALVNESLAADAQGMSQTHVRINADHPESKRNDGSSALRLSDRDPLIAYIAVPPQKFSDLSLEADNIVQWNGTVYARVILRNLGPDIADFPAVGFAFNAALPDLVVYGPLEWTCDHAQVTGTMTSVACTRPWQSHDYPPTFWVPFNAANLPDGEPLTMMASASSLNNEINPGNNTASTVLGDHTSTKMALAWTAPAQVSRGSSEVVATVQLSNLGQDVAALQPVLVLTADAASDAVTVATPYDWRCKPDTSPRFKAFCYPTSGIGTSGWYNFELRIANPGRPSRQAITLRAQVSSFSYDPVQSDNQAETVIQVTGTR